MLTLSSRTPAEEILIVHPLDDTPEVKVDLTALGLMPRTPLVKWSLLALRAYVGIIAAMIALRVIELAAARLA